MIWGGLLIFCKTYTTIYQRSTKSRDYVKMLNDLSLALEGCRLCEEELIFQQDNVAIHNESIKKNNFKIWLLDHIACSPDPNPIENLSGLIVTKVYEGDWQYSAISESRNAILDGSTSETSR